MALGAARGNGLAALQPDRRAPDLHHRPAGAPQDEAEETVCSLHSAALELGLPPVEVKPRCCSLWPLALTEGPVPVLSINAQFASFPCNLKKPALAGIDEGIQETIRIYFGDSFLSELLSKTGG